MKIITYDLNHDLLHTKSIVCATVDSQCLEYLGYITLLLVLHSLSNFFQPKLGCCLDTIVIVYNLQFGLDTKDLLHYDCYPKHSHAITHSICTVYSCFENQGRFVTLNCFFQKAGCKKLRSLLFKKRRDKAASFFF